MEKKTNVKKILNQLSQSQLNLIVNQKIIGGSDSGSLWFTITDNGSGWSISDLWDSSNPNNCQNVCKE